MIRQLTQALLLLSLFLPLLSNAEESPRLAELNAYWAEVSRTVKEGDFDGYQATCHPEGVLISGSKKTSYPLAQALKKWKPGFLATASGKVTASVEFRFSQRWGDNTTAHETGMFRYSSTDETGKTTTVFIHLEALLIKKDKWLILMENQKSPGTQEEWDQLKALK